MVCGFRVIVQISFPLFFMQKNKIAETIENTTRKGIANGVASKTQILEETTEETKRLISFMVV